MDILDILKGLSIIKKYSDKSAIVSSKVGKYSKPKYLNHGTRKYKKK